MSEQTLGAYLRELRRVAGLTLRQVQERTAGSVKNGYLSQVETGVVVRPSPDVLWDLAEVYGVDYNDLLRRAGHRVARERLDPEHQTVAGLPLSAVAELDEDDQQALRDFVAFLRSRKKAQS
jgi:transcriptional regulator with XRE-family HTH domain